MKRYFKIILMLSIAFYLFPANASAISVQYGLSVDDYVQLYIDGNLVASYDKAPQGKAITGVLDLTEGWHDISIIYKNRWGSNGLRLFEGNGVTTDNTIPLTSLSSYDANGNLISGLLANYYDLNSGNLVTTIYGEGPIDHWYTVIGARYEGVESPSSLWAGTYDGWGCFEERLTGQILVGNQPVPEPATILLFVLGLAGVVGIRRFNK